ncbi:MAG: type IV secretory system conjugative DNA transfer family protein [Vulcanimicrobiaceae bacterium]
MPKISGRDVDLYAAVVQEAKRRGEEREIAEDPDRLRRLELSIRYYREKNETSLSVAEPTWQSVQLLAERYGLLPWLSDVAPPEDSAEPDLDPLAAIEWSSHDPRFEIPEWRSLNSAMRPQDMSRHFLILGETGSGKTKSAVIPLLKSALAYRSDDPERRASLLIIDPKFELREIIKHVMAETKDTRRLVEFGSSTSVDRRVPFFYDPGESESDIEPREAVDQVLQLSPDATGQMLDTRNAFFSSSARDILVDLITLDSFVRTSLGTSTSIWRYWNRLDLKDDKSNAIQIPKVPIDQKNYFSSILAFVRFAAGNQRDAWKALHAAGSDAKVPDSLLEFCRGRREEGSNEYGGVMQSCISFLTILANGTLAGNVSLDPLDKGNDASDILMDECLDNGDIILYCPSRSATSAIADAIGRSLKMQFFKATFRRKNKLRPIFYVCDEFQRFITADPDSGEQSFLDRCRAYRAICVGATPSLASLQHSLGASTSSYLGGASLDIVLNNTGNKVFFRNTDIGTADRLMSLLPASKPNTPHVVAERPLATLSVGECYFLMSDGSWGRSRVELSGSVAEASKGKDTAIVRLSEDITPKSVFALCDEVDEKIDYYQYRRVRIEIDSQGGVLSAFAYFQTKLEHWRIKRVIVETLGLTNVNSAAALILSMGDVGKRKVYPATSLLYHNSRYPIYKDTSLTKESFNQLARSLSDYDRRYLVMLATHVLKSDALIERYAKLVAMYVSDDLSGLPDQRDQSALSLLFSYLADTRSVLQRAPEGDARSLTSTLSGHLENREEVLRFLLALYEVLFRQDGYISASLAKALLLIDEIVDEGADEGRAEQDGVADASVRTFLIARKTVGIASLS